MRSEATRYQRLPSSSVRADPQPKAHCLRLQWKAGGSAWGEGQRERGERGEWGWGKPGQGWAADTTGRRMVGKNLVPLFHEWRAVAVAVLCLGGSLRTGGVGG